LSAITLSPEQEAQAEALVQRLRPAVDDELRALARLLVSKPEHELFGQTEFQVRDLVHRLGTKAYEVHLAEKKTATAVPVSTAPPADRPPSTRTTGRRRR
jgi:hypothetical protein